MTMKAVIIDDDQINISLLCGLLNTYCQNVNVAATATIIEDGIKVIFENSPDVLFLDVEIHDRTGFDLLNVVENESMHVVLITAYDKYAVKAIKHEVADYLLKPVKIEELIQSVKKVQHKIEVKKEKILEQQTHKLDCLAIHNKSSIDFIPFNEIIHLTANGGYTEVYTIDKKTITSRSLKEIEGYLPATIFIRVHHSHIINRHKIVKLLKVKHGSLIMLNKIEVPISESKKKDIGELLGYN